MGKNLADLQSNISISATNAVTGDIEWCSGYTQFSTDIGEQAGWYLALQVTPDIEDATVTAAYNGTIRELDNNIYIIRLADGEDTITFTAEKEGYTTGRLTLNLSGLNKETITNYCYVRSLTNGITVTPLQFGESKDLSGVVPYDTTTSSNHFTLKYRTFIPIPNGSEISVSHFGTELGSSTFSTVTPQEGEPYSEATVDITITQDILDSQSPGLSTLIIPDTGEVLDRFYCSLNVDDVTLEAPDVSYLLDITLSKPNKTDSVGNLTVQDYNYAYASGIDVIGISYIQPTAFPTNDITVALTGTSQQMCIRPLNSGEEAHCYLFVNINKPQNTPNTLVGNIYQGSTPTLISTITFNPNLLTELIPLRCSRVIYDMLARGGDIVLELYDSRDSSKKIRYKISSSSIANVDFILPISYHTIDGNTQISQLNNLTVNDIQSNLAINNISGWWSSSLQLTGTSHYLTNVTTPGNYAIVGYTLPSISYNNQTYTMTDMAYRTDGSTYLPPGLNSRTLAMDGSSGYFVIPLTGNYRCDIVYRPGIGSINTLTTTSIYYNRMTKEPAPLPQMGVTINGFTYNNNTYSLTDILNNSSTAVLTAAWEDNELVTNISGLNIKYNDIKGDGTFVHPIGITFENGMHNGKEIVHCFTVQGASGVIDGSAYNLPHTYIVEINDTNQNQFSLGFKDIEDTSVYLYLNIKNSTLETAP